MPTKKKPAKKVAKAEPKRDAADQVLFDKGRHARKGGIRREDAPLTGADRETWQAGWDYQDKA